MGRGWVRRAASGVCAVALAGLVAACADNPPLRENYPPPAPPPAYGSTAPWPVPRAARAAYVVRLPLHLRAAPSVAGPVLGTLLAGTPVRATGSLRDGWWEVQTPEGTGWVPSQYLAPM